MIPANAAPTRPVAPASERRSGPVATIHGRSGIGGADGKHGGVGLGAYPAMQRWVARVPGLPGFIPMPGQPLSGG